MLDINLVIIVVILVILDVVLVILVSVRSQNYWQAAACPTLIRTDRRRYLYSWVWGWIDPDGHRHCHRLKGTGRRGRDGGERVDEREWEGGREGGGGVV